MVSKAFRSIRHKIIVILNIIFPWIKLGKCVDSNNQIEPCLSRSRQKVNHKYLQPYEILILTFWLFLKLYMYIKGSLMQRKCLIWPPRQSVSLFRNCALYSLTHCLFAKARVSLLPHLRCIYMSISVRALSPFLARWISKEAMISNKR